MLAPRSGGTSDIALALMRLPPRSPLPTMSAAPLSTLPTQPTAPVAAAAASQLAAAAACGHGGREERVRASSRKAAAAGAWVWLIHGTCGPVLLLDPACSPKARQHVHPRPATTTPPALACSCCSVMGCVRAACWNRILLMLSARPRRWLAGPAKRRSAPTCRKGTGEAKEVVHCLATADGSASPADAACTLFFLHTPNADPNHSRKEHHRASPAGHLGS